MGTTKNLPAATYPSQDQVPSGPGRAALRLLPGWAARSHDAQAADAPDEPLVIEPDLDEDQIARCVTIWSWLRQERITREAALREIKYVEQNVPPCDSCRIRSATINDAGFRVCGSCYGVTAR